MQRPNLGLYQQLPACISGEVTALGIGKHHPFRFSLQLYNAPNNITQVVPLDVLDSEIDSTMVETRMNMILNLADFFSNSRRFFLKVLKI